MVCFFTLKILKYVKFILEYDEQYNLTLTTLRKLSGSQNKEVVKKKRDLLVFSRMRKTKGVKITNMHYACTELSIEQTIHKRN